MAVDVCGLWILCMLFTVVRGVYGRRTGGRQAEDHKSNQWGGCWSGAVSPPLLGPQEDGDRARQDRASQGGDSGDRREWRRAGAGTVGVGVDVGVDEDEDEDGEGRAVVGF